MRAVTETAPRQGHDASLVWQGQRTRDQNIHRTNDTVPISSRSRRRVAWMAATSIAVLAILQPAATAQRGGFGGPPMGQERKILAQFDKDGNKRLDAAERKAAREWLATQPA